MTAGPYADALQRYLSSFKNRDFASALSAAEEAVALEPGLVEPYHCRAGAWQELGDDVRAAADRARCAALDPHYPDAVAIRDAAQQLRTAYERDPVLGDLGMAEGCGHDRLREILEQRTAEIRRRRAVLARPSCSLPCPSACCYFEDETYNYGVCFTASEADAIGDHLRARALDPDDYVATVRHEPQVATGPTATRSAGPGNGQNAQGEIVLWYPRRDARPYPGASDSWRPRTRTYRDLSWLTGRSRACVFVRPDGCAIHDVGTPPGITGCRTFLCIASFVFLLLDDIGVARADGLAGRTMAELQEMALVALPLLVARFCAPAVARDHEQMRGALADAAQCDRAGAHAALEDLLARYDSAHRRTLALETAADLALTQILAGVVARAE